MMKIIPVLGIIVLFTGCASMLTSVPLPVQCQIVDAVTGNAITNAEVELQWSVGFQGYYWGRPVKKSTDTNGAVVFSTTDVPPVSSDGYGLKGPIKKLFITAVVVSAPGFDKVAVKYPEKLDVIRLKKQ